MTPLDLTALLSSARCYVCGPTGFVEHTSALLLTAGYAPDQIRTEHFG